MADDTTGRAILKWSPLDRVLILCASPGTVSEESFRPLLEVIERTPIDGMLAMSLGDTHMTVIQRTDAAKILKDKGHKTVVLTDSRMTRGILTAISWFGGEIEARPLDDLEGGLDALSLSSGRRDAVRAEALRLRDEVERERRKTQGVD